ncbi:MAG: hypothetical protein ACI9XO_002027 [Paraglaciecola sp.]|jgi:hypothetical protein
MKYFTKNVFAFLMAMAMVGMTNMTAQTSFWTDDFGDMAAFDTNWTGGGMNDGTEVWTWSDDPTALLFGGQPEFAATTVANGFAIFNSDGNGENPHDVTLTTANPINCMGQSTVYLRSENQYAFFNTTSVVQVGVSTDGMVFTYYPILAIVPANDLSSGLQIAVVELPEAANEPEVWIQFRWQGNFEYTWRIDDVALFDADPTPSVDFSLGDFFYSPASFAQPILQIDTDTLSFDADVANTGGEELTNVTVTGTITDETGAVLFTDVSTMATVPTDSIVNFLFDDSFSPENLELGVYNFNYEVTADQVDQNTADNVGTEVFLVTETLWSKDNATISGSRPGDGGDYLMGNLYTSTSTVLPETRFFENVIFNAAVNPVDAPLAGKEATIILARVKDDVVDAGWNTFDVNADLTTNEGLDLLAFVPHTFTGANFDLQTVELLNFDEEAIEIEPGTRYIIALQYAGESNVVFQGIANDLDYFQISTILYTSQWFLGGFGADNAATIRLTTRAAVSTEDNPLPAESMTLFPNPTSERISLDINLENTGLTNILLMDMTGKIMQVKEYDNLANGTYEFNTSSYPNGIYMARLVTADGSRTVKFTVQH